MTTPEILLRICRHTIDPDAKPLGVHPGHHSPRVLRAATRHGQVIVKLHRNPVQHGQELHAYHHWVPALGAGAPRLLAHTDNPPAIVITALSGTPLANLSPSLRAAGNLYRQAGELLRTLHHAEPPRTQPDMTAWLAQRGYQWLALADDILPARQRADIRSHLHALAALGPLPAVPCHLDFTPRNLLRTSDGAACIIDFEHARYDLPARDLVRLHQRVWEHRPDLQDAFLAGYGPLTDLDNQVIDHCAHLDILTAAVRATGRCL